MNSITKDISRRLLLKHTATVHSSSRLTILQKKIFNLFIYKAFPTIKEDKYHTFTVSDLMKSLNWSDTSNMNDRLKESLAGLTRENVRWNILEKDKKNKWVSSACLADVSIKEGVIEYSFGKFLREVLYNPNIYAKIDLDIQSTLESKDSLIIWEFATEELSSKKTNTTVTTWVEWEKICALTSGEETIYSTNYALYKSKVLKKALTEINNKTDLTIKLMEKKEGRKIKYIAFEIQRETLEEKNAESVFGVDVIPMQRNLSLKSMLENVLNKLSQVEEVWATYTDFEIERAISFYKETIQDPGSNIKNPVAFFTKALEQGWCSASDAKERALEEITLAKDDGNKYVLAAIELLDEPEDIKNIRKTIFQTLGSAVYSGWFQETKIILENGILCLEAPSEYSANWINNRYGQLLNDVIRSLNIGCREIIFSVKKAELHKSV